MKQNLIMLDITKEFLKNQHKQMNKLYQNRGATKQTVSFIKKIIDKITLILNNQNNLIQKTNN